MLLELARRNLERIKVRSILAIVGILIGVMAIGSIGIFGESLKAAVMKNFKDVVNQLNVYPNFQEGYTYIEQRDLRSIEKIELVESVTPIRSDSSLIVYREKKTYATVYALNDDFLKKNFKVEKGDINLKNGCVVGKLLADHLSLKVGSKIYLDNNECRVSAILENTGARFDINPNFAVIVSEDYFEKISNARINLVVVKVKSLENVEEVKSTIEKTINRKDERVVVFELKIIVERISEAFNQINLFLIAIASVSLLVAGVSILNVMLISTIERTKEIGVMRAIGAQRSTVMKIFLMEAMVLGLIGSTIGAILSIFGGILIDYALLKDFSYVFQLSTIFYVFLGILIGVTTSLLSGLYPAWKASKLEPIEALRYE
ncbi:MAG: ABC transporter permease [Archaeoglobaceae archaeon]|nr:ABC transporter permease [Archaeoglobaceae archaeon]MCX8151920.1 ABC transporter permease [Archaeoglobaceae archaeon]MDW8013309.1 ABC transporter permease [Archaeoglobaceae archaeon]